MRFFNSRIKRLLLLTFALSFVAGSLGLSFLSTFRHAPERPDGRPVASAPEQALENYGRVPLSFEANRGQTDGSVNFLAHGAGYTLFLKPAEAALVLSRRKADASTKVRAPKRDGGDAPDAPAVLRMRLVGANSSAAAVGADELEGKANYLVGDDPSKWRTNVPTYGRVRYAGVYPGVDLVYYGNQRQLEYDFRIAPGADPRAVNLRFDGADKVEVDAAGDLLLTLGESVVRQPKPLIYQEAGGVRRAVEGGYEVGADGRVRFALGEYDASQTLVIDPVIVYSTYLGGSDHESAQSIAVDSAGSAYLLGGTASSEFPMTTDLSPTTGGIFVTKLNPAGTAIVYSTLVGGSISNQGWDIALDSAGAAYVTGNTRSTDFPTVNPIQATLKGVQDSFAFKLNPAGTALVYSTYLGGTGPGDSERGRGVAVDSAGNAYLTGDTQSNDFPLTAGAFQTTRGGAHDDVYVTKLNASGTAIIYSTLIGGDTFDDGRDIAVDCAGNAYVTGYTFSENFPVTAGAFQPTFGGSPAGEVVATSDGFVTKLDAAGATLVYSSYLGGDKRDEGLSIAIDAAGNAYVTGLTLSFNFPTANAIQPANNAAAGVPEEAFVTKVSASGAALVYSTYLGGGSGEVGQGIAVDSVGNAYITGVTTSTNFPTVNAVQSTFKGDSDAFITKVNAAGTAFAYSTYLGGSGLNGEEQGIGIALDSAGSAYVIGNTGSTDFPTVNPIQATKAGPGGPFPSLDAFVTKIAEPIAGAASQFQFTQTSPSVQEDVTFVTMTVQRTGDTTQAATVEYATANGTASERSDYTTAVGTLRFAAGETQKSFDVLITDDGLAEPAEAFTVSLSNPTGPVALNAPASVALSILDNDQTPPAVNPIDGSQFFVRQHYHDFLNREPDAAGLQFWTNEIEQCGADAQCREVKRVNVSAAFFLSIEFQETGYLVYRLYWESFARPPRFSEFIADTQEIGRGVIVGQGAWQPQLAGNRQSFAAAWVTRPAFRSAFDGLSNQQYVNLLYERAQVTPTAAERDALVAALDSGAKTRARVLLDVADNATFKQQQFNRAFVLMEYFGYLRRNPDDPPDGHNGGYFFWLGKLEEFGGDYVRAEMVKAFINSTEYRGRFGQP